MSRRANAVVVLALGLASCAQPEDPAPAVVEESMTAFVTGYTYHDNTPPKSAAISHPVLHAAAGGIGTFQDPITMAVGHSRRTGTSVLDFPAGTKFYLPYLDKYFIVEDTCGDGPEPEKGPCHTGQKPPATAWLDIWLDGRGHGAAAATECAESITGNHTVIRNPSPDENVSTGWICG